MLQERPQMLQNSKPRGIINDIRPVEAEQKSLAEVVDWAIGLLRRQYLVILVVTALALGAGYIYLHIATPIYTAQASLVVDLHRSPIAQQQGIFNNDPIEIESQIQIIKSDAVASAVIQKLQLMSDPEFVSTEGIISKLTQLFHSSPAQSSYDPLQSVIASFAGHLAVEQAGGRVITIKYSAKSRDRAAQIANGIAQAYITYQLDSKYEESRVASGWLQERIQQLKEQAEAAEHAVESFKKQHNIIITDGKPIDDQQITDLNSRLIATRAQTSDLLTRLNQLQNIIRLGASNPNVDSAIAIVNSPIMITLRQQYLDLSRREAEWSARYGHNHLAVVNLRSRMQEIRQSIFDELQRAAETTKSDYELSKQRQADIKKQLEEAVAKSAIENQAQAPLRGLEATASTYRDRYKNFLQQYTGTAQQAAFPITDARLISPASPLLETVKPQHTLILALSLIGGIGFGFGLAILRDLMDRVFRTEKQLEETLNVPCIAVVPLVKESQIRQPQRKEKPSDDKIGEKTIVRGSNVFWTVVDSPLSSFSEAIRSIKLAIDLSMAAGACKVVGFTSTVPNEGKSTLAAALAKVIAQAQFRVLLIDCDLRNPTLSGILAPKAALGIMDILSGKNSVADAILREPNSKMEFLPTGKRIPLFLTSDILSGEPMSKLFEGLRKMYDYIIVDLPPLAPIVDARASTHLIDSAVLAVAWGQTGTDMVQQALRNAPRVYDRLIGTVLNKTDMDFIKRYDARGLYSYNKDYARYGYTE